ncbi:RHS Repeat family protein [Lysobacter capsici]|uniref:putative Ig domain-containing protein n=1 Tax=Lysobacter capsici TaxID=435897 RepID=UPI000716439F|nr:putative Ig domain-containing protein [Lysobacter capsici]ALN87410.1 RHS Repeat family protein [Lysobacter capsici]
MAAVISGSGLGLFNSSFSQIGKGLGASARYGQGQDSQYVNIATGNLLLHSFDDQVVMRGMTVGFSRTYNSRGTFADAGNDAWLTGFERRIELIGTLNQAGSVMRRHSGDGSYQDFAYAGNGLYRSTVGDGAHDSLRRDGKTLQWLYEEGDTRLEETYADPATGGRLTRIRDLKSDPQQPTTWNLSYDPQGRVTEVAANDGNGNLSRMQFTYAGANLASVTSYSGGQAVGRVWYGYDAAGRLSTVTHDLTPGKTGDDEWSATAAVNDGHLFRTVYSYVDASSLQIASVQHSDGGVVSYTYDALGRVRTLTRGDLNDNDADGQGQTLSFAYDTEARSTRVSDSTGRTWIYYYDESNQLIAAEQPSAGGWQETYTYEYDADGNLTAAMVDGAAGRVYRHDANGNAIEQREFISSGLRVITRVTERSFNAANQITSETVYEVDEGDILGRASASAGAGSETGKNEALTPPANALITRYIYDAANRLRFVVNAAGEVSESEYASAGFGIGRILKARQYLDATYTGAYTLAALEAWAGAAPRKANSGLTQYSYDAFGSVAWRRYAAVDAAGNGIAGDADLIEGYRYDERGRVLERNASSGADLRRTVYVYDGMGRLLAEKVFDRNALALQSRSWAYADSQRLATAIVEGGAVDDGDISNDRVRIEQRDAAGQVVLVSERALGGPTTTRETRNLYDRAGLLRAVQDANGGRSYLFYDVERQLVGEVDATGALVEYVRDTFGRIVQTVRYATVLDTRAWMPAPPASPDLAQVPTDIALVRPTATPQDRTVTTFYDLLGRKTVETDGEGRVTYFSYDLNDRLIRTRQLPRANAPQNEERITRYFYDAMGRELGRLDAEGYLVEHNYDLAGNRTRSVAYASAVASNLREATLGQMRPAATAQDQVTLWFFDGRGNTLAMLDAEGYLTQYLRNERLAQDTTRAFETQLTGLTGTETLATLLSRAQAGRVRETRRGYDALDRLIVQTDPEGTVTRNTYDAQDNLVRTELAADTSEVREGRLRYNVFGELIGELGGEGTTRLRPDMTQAQIDAVFAQYGTRHGYDGLGRRIESIDADGHKTWYFHDADGRPTYTVRGLPGTSGLLNARGEVSQVRYSAFGDAVETTAYTGLLTIAVPGDRDSVATALTTLAYTAASDSRRSYSYNRRGQLAEVRDAENAVLRYSYNGHGDRTVEQRAFGTALELRIDSSYDNRGLIKTRIEAPNTVLQRQLSWSYDAFGRVVEATDARGAPTTFGYDRLGRQVSRSQTVQGRAETWTSNYDAYARVLSQTDPNGRSTSYFYDTAARSMRVTTPEGVEVTTAYTRHGQQLSVSQAIPGGGIAVTSYRYDRDGRLLSVTDPLNKQAVNEYDSRGLLSASVDASGRRVELRYDAVGRVLQRIEDPQQLALTTSYVYDGQGRSQRVTDASGRVVQHRYDREGRLLETALDPDDLNLRTGYSYDAHGRQLTVTEGAGTARARTVRYDYDVLGRRIGEVVDPAGLALTTGYVFDANDNLLRRYVIDEGSQRYTQRSYYDEANRLIYSVDATGAIVRRWYDPAGREVATRAYLDATAPAGLSDTTTLAQLHGLSIEQAGDQGSYIVYDGDGRVRYRIDLHGRISESRYDVAGRLASELNYSNAIAVSDALRHRLRAGTVPPQDIAALIVSNDARMVRHVYDAVGRERYTLVQDSASTATVSERRFDDSGRVVAENLYGVRIPISTALTEAAVTTALGIAGGTGNLRQTRYVYDQAGRARYTVDDAGAVVAREYDEAGRVTVVREYEGLIAAATPMTETGLSLAVAGMRQRMTVTRYDNAGRVERVTDAAEQMERYTYDASGLLIELLDRNALVWTYGYDGAGRRVTETSPRVDVSTIDADGVVSTQNRSIVTRTNYNALGQVLSRSEDDGTAQARMTHYEYDAAGRQNRTVFPLAGRIDPATGALDIGGTRPSTEVGYDSLGRAVVNKDVSGRYSYKVYDDFGQLYLDIDPAGYVTRYEYNVFGERTGLYRHATAFNFGALSGWSAGHAIGYAQSINGVVYDAAKDRGIATIYDKRGQVARVEQSPLEYYRDDGTAATGRPTTAYEYDAYGRKVKESVLLQGTRGQSDARWADSYFYYDDLGRLVLSVDAEGYVTANEYHPTGELKRRIEYARAIATSNLSAATPPSLPASGDDIVGFDRITRWEYDPLGRKHREYMQRHFADSQGSSGVREVMSQFEYDGRDRLIRLSDDTGVTSTVYDALGRAINLTEPARNVLAANADSQLLNGVDLAVGTLYAWASPYTQMRYDAFGNVIETRRYANGLRAGAAVADDQRDQIERVRYDGQGRAVVVFVKRETDTGAGIASGNRTYLIYDDADRIVERWSVLDTDLAGGAVRVHDRFRYDAAGRQLESQRTRESAAGAVLATDLLETVGYNAFGEIVSKQYGDVAGVLDYRYDLAGRLLSDNETGAIRSYGYNLAGHRVREAHFVLGAAGVESAVTRFGLDRLGRTIASELPAYQDGAAPKPTTSRQLDRWGNVLSIVDTRGYRTDYRYNERDQVTRDERPLVEVVSESGVRQWLRPVNQWFYDALGRLVATRDANGNTRTNEYDATGRMIASADALNQKTLFAFDVLGNQRLTQNPMGYLTYKDYDNQGRIVGIGDYLPTSAGIARERKSLQRYVLNQNGDRNGLYDALDNLVRYRYDSAGRVVRSQSASGAVSTYGYDDQGRKTAEFNGIDTMSWSYDVQGRLIAHRNLGGRDLGNEYDPVTGQLVNERQTGGAGLDVVDGARRTTYYPDGRVKAVYEQGSATPSYRYEYDAAGNRVVEEVDTRDASGRLVRTRTRTVYDSNNRIQRVYTDELGSGGTPTKRIFDLSYSYDAAGNRRSVRASSGYGPNATGVGAENTRPQVVQTPPARWLRSGQNAEFSIVFSDIFRDAEQDALTLGIGRADGLPWPSWLQLSGPDANGQVRFIADPPAGTVQQIEIRLSATENRPGGLSEATSFVLSVGANRAPTVIDTVQPVLRAKTGQPWGRDLLASDYFLDPDLGDVLRLELESASPPTSDWLSAAPDGGLLRLRSTLTPATPGDYSLRLRATDQGGRTAIKTVVIRVVASTAPTGPNTLPPRAATLGREFEWSMPLASVFTDADGDRLSIGTIGLPNWLSFQQTNEQGQPQLRLSGHAPDDVAAGHVYTFQFKASDESGNSKLASLSITLRAFNTDPYLGGTINDAQMVLIRDGSYYPPPLPAFLDSDGDAVSVRLTGLPPGLSFDPVTRQIGGNAPLGTYWLTYSADDGRGGSVSQSLRVIVRDNTPPTVPAFTPPNPRQGAAYRYVIPESFDPDEPVDYWVNAQQLPPGLSFNNLTREITGVPTAQGSFNVTMSVWDRFGATTVTSFAMTVSAPAANQPPVATVPSASLIFEMTSSNSAPPDLTLDAGLFVDPDGNPMSYTMSGHPSWLRHEFGPDGHVFRADTSAWLAQSSSFTLTADDGEEGRTALNITVRVRRTTLLEQPGIDPPVESFEFDMGTGLPPHDQKADSGIEPGVVEPGVIEAAVPVETKEYWYTYDAENRIKINNGVLQGGQIVLTHAEPESYELRYDAAGNIVARFSLRLAGPGATVPTLRVERSVYDLRGNRQIEFHQQVVGGGVDAFQGVRQRFEYDANNRLIQAREYYANSMNFDIGVDGAEWISLGGWLSAAEVYVYDIDGRLISLDTKGRAALNVSWIRPAHNNNLAAQYTDLGVLQAKTYADYRINTGRQPNGPVADIRATGYDAAGRLVRYDYSPDASYASTQRYSYTYYGWDSYQEKTVTGTRPAQPAQPSTTNTLTYDSFGRLRSQLEHTRLSSGSIEDRMRYYSYDGDGRVQTRREGVMRGGVFTQDGAGGPGNYFLVHAGGQQQAELREGVQLSSGLPSRQIQSLGGRGYYQAGGDTVIAQPGDTLRSLAQRVYGAEQLWYLLADANGLGDPDQELAAGTQLTAPDTTVAHNDASTFKPYDPAAAIGPTAPGLPMIAPPPKNHCNAVAMVLMVVVAVVVSVVTYGALAAPAAAWVGSATGGAILAGAAAGAASSVASQAVGSATGVSSFSWRNVAASAIAGGITAGIGATSFGEAMKTTTQGRAALAAIGSAANYVGQKVAGLDTAFSWRNVAASAVSAAVSSKLNGALGLEGEGFAVGFGANLTEGVVSLHVRQAFGVDGAGDYGRIALDAFGNALGNWVASNAGGGAKTLEARLSKSMAATQHRLDAEIERDTALSVGADLDRRFAGLAASADMRLSAAIDMQADARVNMLQWSRQNFASTQADLYAVVGGRGRLAAASFASMAVSASGGGVVAVGDIDAMVESLPVDQNPGFYKDDSIVRRNLAEQLEHARNAGVLERASWYLSEHRGRVGEPEGLTDARRELRAFEQAPDFIPLQAVQDYYGRMMAYDAGELEMSAQEAARLRLTLNAFNRFYMGDTPLPLAGQSEAETEAQRRFANDVGMSFLGVFALPAMLTRAVGGNETRVGAALQAGAVVLDLYSSRSGSARGPLRLASRSRTGRQDIPGSRLGKLSGEYSAMNPGPLDDGMAGTFAGGRYKAVVLDKDTVLYRAGTQSQPLGQYFSRQSPLGVLQTRIDKAVLPQWPGGGKSPIDTVFAVKIPAGTEVYVGKVGTQGGFYVGGTQQIVVRKPWQIDGVQVIDWKPLK